MDYQKLIDTMTPDVYQRLKRSVETGNWPDGKPVTAQQRESSMQAIIAYGERHLSEEERVGFLPKKTKASGREDGSLEKPLVFKDQG
ncbi:MAG: hypothetical protein ACI9JM_003188 [Halioglobus sp.]|jgi:uncharacterized protein YeaC (DUF1315 family)